MAVAVGLYANHAVSSAMQKTTVVVASHKIQPFTQITAKDVHTTTRPAAGVPDHAASTLQQVVGTYTKTMILEGNPVQKGQLALGGASDLSSVLTSLGASDIRAFSIPSKNPMIQRIHPGDRVDLYAAVGDKKPPSSFLVAEKVLVLGVAKKDNKAVGLILVLSPKQIQTILPVMDTIEISLVPDQAPKNQMSQSTEKRREASHDHRNTKSDGHRNQ